MRDDLAAARAVLKKHSMMLLTASKAYVRHPELAAAKANRDYVLRQVFPFPTLDFKLSQIEYLGILSLVSITMFRFRLFI